MRVISYPLLVWMRSFDYDRLLSFDIYWRFWTLWCFLAVISYLNHSLSLFVSFDLNMSCVYVHREIKSLKHVNLDSLFFVAKLRNFDSLSYLGAAIAFARYYFLETIRIPILSAHRKSRLTLVHCLCYIRWYWCLGFFILKNYRSDSFWLVEIHCVFVIRKLIFFIIHIVHEFFGAL